MLCEAPGDAALAAWRCAVLRDVGAWQELTPLLQSELPPHLHTPGVMTITSCAWCHQTEAEQHVFLTWILS